jgi:hypothetical protein
MLGLTHLDSAHLDPGRSDHSVTYGPVILADDHEVNHFPFSVVIDRLVVAALAFGLVKSHTSMPLG